MGSRGLVERVYDGETGQLIMTATPMAEQTMRVATALHNEAVRRYFLSVATDEELGVVIDLAKRIQTQRAGHGDPRN